MYIGRSFILKKLQNNPPKTGLTVSVSVQAKLRTSLVDVDVVQDDQALLIDDCIKHSLIVIELCEKLNRATGLARFSYTEYTSCCAALVAILAASVSAPA